MRPTMSMVLPAVNGIIARIGRVGQGWAATGRGSADAMSAVPAKFRSWRRVAMSSFLGDQWHPELLG